MSSGVSSPSGSAYDADDESLSTKVKALVADLDKQPHGTNVTVHGVSTSHVLRGGEMIPPLYGKAPSLHLSIMNTL
jgi:hypothetical protein